MRRVQRARRPLWQMARAEFAEPVAEAALPSSLLERFTGKHQERLQALP